MRLLIKYRFKILIKQRWFLFWMALFPLIMGILMKLAFSQLDQSAKTWDLDPISVAVVSHQKTDTKLLMRALTQTKMQRHQIFQAQTLTPIKAQQQLRSKKIAGYFEYHHKHWQLKVLTADTPQQVLQSFLTTYLQRQQIIQQQLPRGQKLTLPLNKHWFINQAQTRNFSILSFYFFTLLAFAIMDGFTLGLNLNYDEQPQQSERGIRLQIGPINYLKIWLSDILAAWIIFYGMMLLALGFFHWVLQVNFGHHWAWLLLTIALGCLLAINGGQLWGRIFAKKDLNQQLSLGLVFVLANSFLSGMMGDTNLKLWIDLHWPLLGHLNPNNLLTNCFYQLFADQNLPAYYHNLRWLMGLLGSLLVLNLVLQRRKSYDHL